MDNIIDVLSMSLKFDQYILNGNIESAMEELSKMNTSVVGIEEFVKKHNRFNIITGMILRLVEANNIIINNLESLKASAKEESNRNLKKVDSDRNTIVLVLFYSNCKESKKFLRVWKEIVRTCNEKLKCVKMNCSKESNMQLCDKFNIYQYPTLKLVISDVIVEYYGDLTYDSIMSFVNSKI